MGRKGEYGLFGRLGKHTVRAGAELKSQMQNDTNTVKTQNQGIEQTTSQVQQDTKAAAKNAGECGHFRGSRASLSRAGIGKCCKCLDSTKIGWRFTNDAKTDFEAASASAQEAKNSAQSAKQAAKTSQEAAPQAQQTVANFPSYQKGN